MSFAEWTATSIRPSSRASSSSLTNTPRAPISPKGLLRSRSPAVVTGTSANSTPGRRRRSIASSACVSARRLPLDPTLRTTALLGGGLLEPQDRLVQELVDHLRGERLDGVPLPLRELRQPGPRLRQLAAADLLRPLPQRGDHGADLACREPVTELRALGDGNRLGLRELRLAAAQRLVHDGLEV